MRSLLLCATLLVAGCQRRPTAPAEPAVRGEGQAPGAGAAAGPRTPREEGQQRSQASRRPPAGSTCSGREDCASDQICVQARCQYRHTSVAGEVLAAAAEAQAEAGDWAGAIESYDQAFEAFRHHDAAVPPEIACAAAALMLRTATDAATRERAAQRADLCFRTSVPGDARRNDVRRAIARLRFEGLDLNAFDQSDPATRFFTQEPSRPTVDAVQVSLEMPDLEHPTRSHEQVREILNAEAGRRAIAECFIQDWETRHDRSATASLVLRYSTRLRDMGTYDLYEPVIEVSKTVEGDDGFEPCLSRSLAALFDAQSRNFRGDPWNQAVRVMARLQ